MAGYSGTPLAKKLGIKPDSQLITIGAPDELASWLDPMPEGVTWRSRTKAGADADVVVLFVRRAEELERRWAAVAASASERGGIWIAWPKKASGVATDVTEETLRVMLLPTGWVDNKVCAISEVWSGLRFVLRKELRNGHQAGG